MNRIERIISKVLIENKQIPYSTINPVPTDEVYEFARDLGNVSHISLYSYNTKDGVIWAFYDKSNYLIGKCDATGAYEK